MKLKVKPEKIEYKRFNEMLGIMRNWPDYQRLLAHELLRHVQYLNENIAKLEKEIKDLKEVHFFEEQKRIETTPIQIDQPHTSPSLKAVFEKQKKTTRGERFYKILEDRVHKKYLGLNYTVKLEDLIFTANQWALSNARPAFRLEDFV